MNMSILAEIMHNTNVEGIFCLASIPCMLIVYLLYKKGLFYGSTTCLILCIFTVFITNGTLFTSMEEVGKYGFTNDFIANRSQTKFMKKDDCITDSSDCIYAIRHEGSYSRNREKIFIPVSLSSYEVFIPEEELTMTGPVLMRSTLKPPTVNDYYLYSKRYDASDVLKKWGGTKEVGDTKIPMWLYHPAAPIWIFGIAGFPSMLCGLFISSKLSFK